MARIRSIKPEFWSDFRLARELPRDVRLFYIGLWTEADDQGRFLAHPRRLLGSIFPYDEDVSPNKVGSWLQLLQETGRVVLYTVDGEPYGELVKFTDHQRINRPSESRIPAPPTDLPQFREDSVRPHGAVTDGSPLEQGTGNREQGDTSDDVARVFAHWKQATGRTDDTRFTDKRRRLIQTRLRKFSADELCLAVDGVMASDFHASKAEYTELTSIFRNDERVEGHIRRARALPAPNVVSIADHMTADRLTTLLGMAGDGVWMEASRDVALNRLAAQYEADEWAQIAPYLEAMPWAEARAARHDKWQLRDVLKRLIAAVDRRAA